MTSASTPALRSLAARNQWHDSRSPGLPEAASVTSGRWPYPYRAMLPICSDLDGTPDGAVYWEMMWFLNTTLVPREHQLIGNGMRFDPITRRRLDERWRATLSATDLAAFEQVAGSTNR